MTFWGPLGAVNQTPWSRTLVAKKGFGESGSTAERAVLDSIAPMTEWLESPAVPRETMVQLSGGAFFEPRQYCRTFSS